MAQLRCDEQGFLLGEPLDLGAIAGHLSGMGEDIRAIRAAMSGLSAGADAPQASPQAAPITGNAEPVVDVAVSVHNTAPTAEPRGRADPRQTRELESRRVDARSEIAAPRQRNASGRFERSGAGENQESPEARNQRDDLRFKQLGETIAESVGEPPEIDPLLSAYNEIARPLGRGMKLLNRGDEKQEGWLKKIWRALIEPKADDQDAQGGLLGGLRNMLGLGGGRNAPPVPVGGAAAAAAGGGRMAGLLRRLPLIGGLIGGAMLGQAVLGSENNDSLSRREKDQSAGQSIGGFGGMLAGGAAGATAGAIAGLPGMIVGGVIGAMLGDSAGQIIGTAVGGWVNDLRGADIAGTITNAWSGLVASIGGMFTGIPAALTGAWSAVTTAIGAGFTALFGEQIEGIKKAVNAALDKVKAVGQGVADSVKQGAQAANEFIKDKTGVDLGGMVEQGAASVQKGLEVARQGVTAVKDAAKEKLDEFAKSAEKLLEQAREKGGQVVKTVVNVAAPVVQKAMETAKVGVQKAGEVASNTTVGKVAIGAAGVAGGVWSELSGTPNDRKAVLLRQAKNEGINNPKELANFMGQIDHETGGFRRMQENLNYSAPGLLKTFKGRNGINTIEDAQRVVSGGKESIANAVYGGEWGKRNLGNIEDGDGYKYRGRGFKQLTGRSNFAQAGNALGIDLVNNPELAEQPEIAAKIAAWYWKKRVPEHAKTDVDAATKAINGGDNGLVDRKARAAQWERAIASGEAEKIAARAKTEPVSSVPSALPSSVAALPIKGNDGRVRTLDEMGVKSWDELQSKGGQAFAGGHNDPATLYATSLIAKDLGDNFGRVTAQNDTWHAQNKPKSEHTQGNKTDFTVKNMSYAEAHQRTAETMRQNGLEDGKDFKIISTPHGTGNHIDFKLAASGREKMNAKMQAEARAAEQAKIAAAAPSANGAAFNAAAKQARVAEDPAAQAVDAAYPSMPSIPAVSASMPTSLGVVRPAAPPIAAMRVTEAPAQNEPLAVSQAGMAGRGNNNQDYGNHLAPQDIRDRRMAHVITGGLSNLA